MKRTRHDTLLYIILFCNKIRVAHGEGHSNVIPLGIAGTQPALLTQKAALLETATSSPQSGRTIQTKTSTPPDPAASEQAAQNSFWGAISSIKSYFYPGQAEKIVENAIINIENPKIQSETTQGSGQPSNTQTLTNTTEQPQLAQNAKEQLLMNTATQILTESAKGLSPQQAKEIAEDAFSNTKADGKKHTPETTVTKSIVSNAATHGNGEFKTPLAETAISGPQTGTSMQPEPANPEKAAQNSFMGKILSITSFFYPKQSEKIVEQVKSNIENPKIQSETTQGNGQPSNQLTSTNTTEQAQNNEEQLLMNTATQMLTESAKGLPPQQAKNIIDSALRNIKAEGEQHSPEDTVQKSTVSNADTHVGGEFKPPLAEKAISSPQSTGTIQTGTSTPPEETTEPEKEAQNSFWGAISTIKSYFYPGQAEKIVEQVKSNIENPQIQTETYQGSGQPSNTQTSTNTTEHPQLAQNAEEQILMNTATQMLTESAKGLPPQQAKNIIDSALSNIKAEGEQKTSEGSVQHERASEAQKTDNDVKKGGVRQDQKQVPIIPVAPKRQKKNNTNNKQPTGINLPNNENHTLKKNIKSPAPIANRVTYASVGTQTENTDQAQQNAVHPAQTFKTNSGEVQTNNKQPIIKGVIDGANNMQFSSNNLNQGHTNLTPAIESVGVENPHGNMSVLNNTRSSGDLNTTAATLPHERVSDKDIREQVQSKDGIIDVQKANKESIDTPAKSNNFMSKLKNIAQRAKKFVIPKKDISGQRSKDVTNNPGSPISHDQRPTILDNIGIPQKNTPENNQSGSINNNGQQVSPLQPPVGNTITQNGVGTPTEIGKAINQYNNIENESATNKKKDKAIVSEENKFLASRSLEAKMVDINRKTTVKAEFDNSINDLIAVLLLKQHIIAPYKRDHVEYGIYRRKASLNLSHSMYFYEINVDRVVYDFVIDGVNFAFNDIIKFKNDTSNIVPVLDRIFAILLANDECKKNYNSRNLHLFWNCLEDMFAGRHLTEGGPLLDMGSNTMPMVPKFQVFAYLKDLCIFIDKNICFTDISLQIHPHIMLNLFVQLSNAITQTNVQITPNETDIPVFSAIVHIRENLNDFLTICIQLQRAIFLKYMKDSVEESTTHTALKDYQIVTAVLDTSVLLMNLVCNYYNIVKNHTIVFYKLNTDAIEDITDKQHLLFLNTYNWVNIMPYNDYKHVVAIETVSSYKVIDMTIRCFLRLLYLPINFVRDITKDEKEQQTPIDYKEMPQDMLKKYQYLFEKKLNYLEPDNSEHNNPKFKEIRTYNEPFTTSQDTVLVGSEDWIFLYQNYLYAHVSSLIKKQSATTDALPNDI